MKNRFLTAIVVASAALITGAFADEAPKASNTKCPFSGEDIDAAHVVAYTKVVGVCCEKCNAKLKENVGENLEKISKIAAKPVNSKCPLSGKEVDATKTVMFKGATVALCCEKCQAKFDAEKDGAKVVMDVPANDKCLFSGKDIDASQNVVVSLNIGVCCEKCEAKLKKDPEAAVAKLQLSKAE